MQKLNARSLKRLTKEQVGILKQYLKEKSEIPIRVVYTQKYWDKIAKDSTYSLASRELTALKKSINYVSKVLGKRKVNVIQLGVGNGVEIPFLVKAIKNIDTYSIVDVNKTMLDISGAKVKKQFPKLKLKKFQTDIETYGIEDICKKTKRGGADINVVVLIANGVLFSNDDLVRDTSKNLNKEDFFVLTLELYKDGKDSEIIQPYLIPSVLDLLSNGIKILGYKIKYEYFDAEIDKKQNRLKVYFSPDGDRSKKLLVLHSYKPNVKQLTQRMYKFGFKTLLIKEYKNIHTCFAVYKKRKNFLSKIKMK